MREIIIKNQSLIEEKAYSEYIFLLYAQVVTKEDSRYNIPIREEIKEFITLKESFDETGNPFLLMKMEQIIQNHVEDIGSFHKFYQQFQELWPESAIKKVLQEESVMV